MARSSSSWAVSPRSLRARDVQRPDEVLGTVHRGPDVRRHGVKVVGRAVRVARHHNVDRRAHYRQRVRSSCEVLAMKRCWPSNAPWSRPSPSSPTTSATQIVATFRAGCWSHDRSFRLGKGGERSWRQH